MLKKILFILFLATTASKASLNDFASYIFSSTQNTAEWVTSHCEALPSLPAETLKSVKNNPKTTTMLCLATVAGSYLCNREKANQWLKNALRELRKKSNDADTQA